MFIYFINYFLLLLAGSVFANGLFLITRGQEELKPDGTKEKKGALLKGWYFYWFKEKGKIKYWYQGDELSELFDIMRSLLPAHILMVLHKTMKTSPNHDKTPTDCIVGGSFQTTLEFLNYLPMLRKKLGVEFKVEAVPLAQDIAMLVYKEEPRYVHSWYLRTVLAGCITCFSSLYGAIFFLLVHLFISNDVLCNSFYDFYGDIPLYVTAPATCLCYCVSLAYINTLLWKKVN